jgi:glycolate oxidase FAD binding subunit
MLGLTPSSIEALQDTLRAHPRVLPRGAGTKTALSTAPDGVLCLDLRELNGIVDYDPAELTFTALAGTPVRDVTAALAAHRQYLPFDPPWAEATLGGVVAAGTSGPGSHRHGGVRDFILGVRFLDGRGTLIGGGGRVVKNAVGFDLPKLMVGSLGRLGVLVEVSFKVFPRPEATATLRADAGALPAALEWVRRLARGPQELEALDFEPPGTLWLRLAGPAGLLGARIERLARTLALPVERVEGGEDERAWQAVRELAWAPASASVVKVALTAARVPALDAGLARAGAARRYSRAANLAWIAWPAEGSLAELDRLLGRLGLPGLVLTGPAGSGRLGAHTGGVFAERVRCALDPDRRFPEI